MCPDGSLAAPTDGAPTPAEGAAAGKSDVLTDIDPAVSDRKDMPNPELTEHVLSRSIVIESARVLFVPVPKSACSSIMWALAEVAGLDSDRFKSSMSIQPTPALTIHDMGAWGDEHRLVGRSTDEIRRLLNDEGWLRFTVVREPVRRLWSAFQSKLMTREPQMVAFFGDQEWFPGPPADPHAVVEDYRRFVSALGAATIEAEVPSLDTTASNPHWAPQTAILGEVGLGLDHIGRVETLDDTVAVLGKHLAELGLNQPKLGYANPSALPFDPALNGSAETKILRRLYVADFARLGYSLPSDQGEANLDGWAEQVRERLDLIRAIAEHNDRFGTLHGISRELGRQLRSEQKRLRSEQKRVASARATKKKLDQRIVTLEANNVRLRQKVDATRADAVRSRGSLSIARANLGFAQAVAADATRRAQAAENRAEQLQSRIEGIQSQFSWRVTSPIRRAAAAWRRLLSPSPVGRLDGTPSDPVDPPERTRGE
jgi:Sulfotransferase family